MKTNVANKFAEKTHECATAKRTNAEQQLWRSVMSCMLWEDTFYEDGQTVAQRISDLVKEVKPASVAVIAQEARIEMKLRHVPLLIVREMARLPEYRGYVASTLYNVIQRADELAEFVSIYWKGGKQPLSSQVKKGLAIAFTKFNEYQLAKYDRDGAVKLRDVLFLCHAKPIDDEQAALWKKLIDGKLEIPDTWETALSAGADKKETFERLLATKQIGALAILRNLRNMIVVRVSEDLVFDALDSMNVDRVLPFRFIAAARYAPQWESRIEKSMLRCLDGQEKLPGKTVLLIDVSGSMDDKLSANSNLLRIDAACGLAILARELCEKVEIITFSNDAARIPDRHGFALRDAIVASQPHGGTRLGSAVALVNQDVEYDRLIVITDEQSRDIVPDPKGKGYMINVAAYKNGVGYGAWTHIDGWSEAVFDYITEFEK